MKSEISLVPCGPRVLVRPLVPPTMTPGGIALPDTAKEKPKRGTVLAVGPGFLTSDGARVALDFAIGDEVVYSAYAGSEYEHEGERLLFLTHEEVLGKMPKK